MCVGEGGGCRVLRDRSYVTYCPCSAASGSRSASDDAGGLMAERRVIECESGSLFIALWKQEQVHFNTQLVSVKLSQI